MITRNKEVNTSNEMKILTICCEEAIEKQIIPELSLIYTIKINEYDDFLKYIFLIESVIKSAAIVQQLRHIQLQLQLDRPSIFLSDYIANLKNKLTFADKYTELFEYYYHDQPNINTYLVTSACLYSHRTYIADLQYLIRLAYLGMTYTTQVARYELPATYYCYTKQFNSEFSDFLQTIINDTYDQQNKKLYFQYDSMPISKEAFSSVITTIAFRLQLAVHFIEHFYATQQLIEENCELNTSQYLVEFFLKLVGKVRTEALNT